MIQLGTKFFPSSQGSGMQRGIQAALCQRISKLFVTMCSLHDLQGWWILKALECARFALEGLCAPELPGVNPGGRPQESGGDSKVI